MNDKKLVLLPKGNHKITFKKINSTVYVYVEYDRKYNPETQHTTPLRQCIGKLSESDPERMIPNQHYPKYFGIEHLADTLCGDRSCTLSVGTFIVLNKIIHDYKIDEYLKTAIPNDSYVGLFLDLVSYEIICGSNVMQHYPNYAFKHPLFTPNMNIFSDSFVGTMLENLSVDHRQCFLNQWNRERNKREKIYVSYDSTNRHSTAGDIQMVEFGKPKDGKTDIPIINQGIAYDCTFREPLFYDSYPGSIVDVSMITHMVEKAVSYGYENIGFILDRGYFAKENLFFMDYHNYDFVIMAKGNVDFIRGLIEDAMGTFELEREFLIPKFHLQGTTVKKKIFEDDDRDQIRFIHVYYNELVAAIERRKLEEQITRWEKELTKCLEKKVLSCSLDSYGRFFKFKFNEQNQLESFSANNRAIEDEKFWYGYFCIITSSEMTAAEALKLYKGRDSSEKLFMIDKSFLGNHCYRVESQSSKDSKEWIGFVAEIVRNKIYTCLMNCKDNNQIKSNELTVPAILGELEKIEISRQLEGGYHLSYPLTKKQKIILSECFNISRENAMTRLLDLCKTINAIEKASKSS